MNIENFREKLFIDVGAKSCYFTLRKTYIHTFWFNGRWHDEVRSHHLFNLSQDPEEAVAKGKAASESMGIPFSASADTLREKINEIKRASAEEIERREREAREREEQWAAERALAEEMIVQAARHGYYAIGAHSNWMHDLRPGYLNWLVKSEPEFAEGSAIRRVAEIVRTEFADLLLPNEGTKHYPAPVGKRIEAEVTVLRQAYFDSFYGTVYITTMVDTDGHSLVVKSGSFNPVVGKKMRIKATIKDHDEYKGVPQTVIQRVAVQKDADAVQPVLTL